MYDDSEAMLDTGRLLLRVAVAVAVAVAVSSYVGAVGGIDEPDPATDERVDRFEVEGARGQVAGGTVSVAVLRLSPAQGAGAVDVSGATVVAVDGDDGRVLSASLRTPGGDAVLDGPGDVATLVVDLPAGGLGPGESVRVVVATASGATAGTVLAAPDTLAAGRIVRL